MASLDLAGQAQPVSEAEPCGPDLDLAGDPDFAQFLARSEGVFPTSFFTRDDEGRLQVFDRATIDFASEFRALQPLLDSTRDLRLLTVAGRLLALNRDLAGFNSCIGAVATLIRERWDDVHPRGEDGDYGLRGAVLQGFDDTPSVVLPLQYIPFVESRRTGPISYRSVMIANGEARAREDEASPDRGAIDRALAEADLDTLKATSGQLHGISDAAAAIQVTTIEKAGYDQAVSLEKLSALVVKMVGVVDTAIAARDPDAPKPVDGAGAPSGAAGPGSASIAASNVPTGRIATAADATEALAALAAYFRRSEPSSPAAILVQQAQRLMGKSFPEVVRLLMPAQAEQARIQLGAEKLFGLAFEQFPDTSDWDAGISEADPETEVADLDGQDSSSESGSDAIPEAAASKPKIQAQTRQDAAALLEQVSLFYRAAEPSSPIPLLTERARGLIDRDFITILKDVLPELVPKRDE